jgi:hypothetical protein
LKVSCKARFYEKNISPIFAVALVVGSILLSADSVRACICLEEPTLDWSTKTSENILLLKLVSLEKYKDGEEQFTSDGIKQAKLIVQKSLKGSMKKGQDVIFPQGETSCDQFFSEEQIGTEFIFYFGKNNFFAANSICSRSSSLKFAADDLLYLEKYQKVFGKTRLSGIVYNVTEGKTDNPMWKKWNYEPIADRKVRVVGNGVDIIVKTNKLGAYEIYDLPVGKYRIVPKEVKGYRILIPSNETIDEVEIKAKRLTEQNIEYLVD